MARITKVPAAGTSASVIATPMANLSQDRQVMLGWNIDSALKPSVTDTTPESLSMPDDESSRGTPPAFQEHPGNDGKHDG